MLTSLSHTQRVVYDRRYAIYDTGKEIVFAKEPFSTSRNGVITGMVILAIHAFIYFAIPSTPPETGAINPLLLFSVAGGMLGMLFFLYCLFQINRRRTASGILPNDRLIIFDIQSHSIKIQKGTLEESILGGWKSFPVLFNVRMHRRSRGAPPMSFWTLRIAQPNEQGPVTTLFSTFNQKRIQAARDAMKKYHIPTGVSANDGTLISVDQSR